MRCTLRLWPGAIRELSNTTPGGLTHLMTYGVVVRAATVAAATVPRTSLMISTTLRPARPIKFPPMENGMAELVATVAEAMAPQI